MLSFFRKMDAKPPYSLSIDDEIEENVKRWKGFLTFYTNRDTTIINNG